MSSLFGLVPDGAGFNAKTTEDLLDSIEENEKADIDQEVDVSADGPLGQINGVFAKELAEAWEVIQAVHGARDPNNAEGAALDALMAITGAFRLEATESTVVLTATGTPATSLLTGRQASTTLTGDTWLTTADATIAAVAAWAATTAYVVGDRVTLGSQVYQATVAGTSGGSGPVGTTQGVTEVDGTVTWINVGPGTGAVDVNAENSVTGPIAANANVITTIDTAVSGWLGVINLLDATPGTDIQTDPAARLRRELLLRQQGKSTLEAVRASVLAVTGVTEAFVFENTSLVTDGDGVPGKAFEVVADGGADADIRQAIFDTKPIGIESHGDLSGSVTDSQGFSHTIEHSRPTDIEIYIDITLTTDGDYPTNGDDQVKDALATKFTDDGNGIGDDVILEQIKCAAFEVSGVVDITDFKIDVTASPTGTSNIAIANRELAKFDTSRITVL